MNEPVKHKGMKISLEPIVPLWLDLLQIGGVISVCVISGFTLYEFLKIY